MGLMLVAKRVAAIRQSAIFHNLFMMHTLEQPLRCDWDL